MYSGVEIDTNLHVTSWGVIIRSHDRAGSESWRDDYSSSFTSWSDNRYSPNYSMFILGPGLDYQHKIDIINMINIYIKKPKNKMVIKCKHQKCKVYLIKICKEECKVCGAWCPQRSVIRWTNFNSVWGSVYLLRILFNLEALNNGNGSVFYFWMLWCSRGVKLDKPKHNTTVSLCHFYHLSRRNIAMKIM